VGVGAYCLTEQLKGNQCRMNQVDLIDVDVSSHGMRGTTWTNLFSPKLATFDLSFRPNGPSGKPVESQSTLSWFGLPGSSLGGMSARAGAIIPQWSQPYRFAANLDAVSDMPIQVGSTKSITARWISSTDAFPNADLTDENELLSGSVTNTLGIPLEQCILAFGRSVYDLGTIAPNESVRIDAMSKRSELKTLLTGKRVVQVASGDKYRHETTPYDQSSTDLAYVLRMMMFHDAAGGRRYTGLLNDYQGFVDLSLLLKTNRAILVAQGASQGDAPRCGSQVLNHDERIESPRDRHLTVYRFVFPVKKGKGG
jgi:hypothetical protein